MPKYFVKILIKDTFQKILVVRLSSLGDVILTTPIYRSLKKSNKDIIIHTVVLDAYKDVLKTNPYINSVWEYSKNSEAIKILNESLIHEEYDYVMDLQNNFRSRELLQNVSKNIYRFEKHSLKKLLLVHFKINLFKNFPSITERYAATFPELKLDNEGPEIFIPSSVKPRIAENDVVIGLCPGSKHFTKMWPNENFVELGNMLIEKGVKVAIFGGSDDKNICKYLERNIKGSINLTTDNDILQIASDMKNCIAIICNDSGLMHTATAVKTNVLAIFGSTVREFGFYPYKSTHSVLENFSLSCRPCSHIGRKSCPKKHFKCMKEITPSQVYDKLQELI